MPLVGYLLVLVTPPQSSICFPHISDKSWAPDWLSQGPIRKKPDDEDCSLGPGVPYLVEPMQEITTHPTEILNLALEAVTVWGIVGTLDLSPLRESCRFLLGVEQRNSIPSG